MFLRLTAIAGIVAGLVIQATGAAAQLGHPDRMTLCQNLAMTAVAWKGQLGQAGTTPGTLRRELAATPQDQAALRPWSPTTLQGVLAYVVRNRGQDAATIGLTVQRACEAQLPEGRQVTTGAWRHYCGDVSQRTYAAALGRDAGVPLDRAIAQAELTTRFLARDVAAGAVYFAYNNAGLAPPQAAMGMLRQCIRLPEVELR